MRDRAQVARSRTDFLQRLLGGGLDDVDEVGAGAAVGAAGEPLEVDAVDRAVSQVRGAGSPRAPARSGGSTSSVRSSRPGRRSAVSMSHGWLVAAEHEHAVVVGLRAVELGQQLVDDVAARRVAQVAALLAERVELVEEEHARRGARAASNARAGGVS